MRAEQAEIQPGEAQPAATRPLTAPATRSLTPANSSTLLLGSLAFVSAGVGEALLFFSWGGIPGVLFFMLAVLLGAAAWGIDPPFVGPWLGATKVALTPRLLLRLLGIGGALALFMGSILTYRAEPDAIFGLHGVLWLASIALVIASCVRWRPSGAPLFAQEEPWTRQERIAFGALILLSLITHLAFLSDIPWRFHFDEGFAYIEMMRFYQGPPISLFTTTWEGTGLPSLWFGIEGLLAHLTGPTLAGVRLSVAIAGALTVVPVYLLARLEWGRLAGIIAAFAVAVSAVYVHYSRISILNITTPLAWAVCFYFLLKGLRTARPTDYMWAGLAGGLSMYTYYGTRLLPYLLAIFFLYLLVFHFRVMRRQLGNLALAVVAFLAGFGPLLGYFTLHPETWIARGLSTLNVPATIPTTWDALIADWNILAPIAWQNFLGLSVLPGKDTVYYAPFMLAPEAALTVLGLGLLALRWRRQPSAFLLLLWLLSSIFLGGVLLDWTTVPNFAHWASAFPVFFLAFSLPLALYLRPLLAAGAPKTRYAWRAILGVLLALDLAANAYTYLVAYPAKVPYLNSMEAVQGRFVESMPPNTHVRVVGNTWFWTPLNPPIARMMSKDGTRLTRFFNPGLSLPVAGEPGKQLAFIFYNDMFNYASLVQSYYPGGKPSQLHTPDGSLVALSYEVDATQAQERYGVFAGFKPQFGAGGEWEGRLDTIGAVPEDTRLVYPLVAEWRGALYVPSSDSYIWTVVGASGVRAWLEGQPIPDAAPIPLEPGWAQFVVSARLERPTTLKFMLQQNSGAPTEPDTPHLWPMPLGQGLAATVVSNSGVAHRIDQAIGAGLLFYRPEYGDDIDPDMLPLSVDGGDPARIRWEGELLTGDGTYFMELRSDASVDLSIDGTPVVRKCATPGGPATSQGSINLTAGWHRVRLDFASLSGAPHNQLEWLWTRPDGAREVVPPQALRVKPSINVNEALIWPEPPPETAGCVAP